MKYTLYFFIAFLPFIFLGCEKDSEYSSKEFPYILTYTPAISTDGITFSAEIKTMAGNNEMKSGFSWSEKSDPNSSISTVYLDEPAKKGFFSFKVDAGLKEGVTYVVRSFIQSNDFKVFGNQITFKSDNVNCNIPPVITNFEPKTGRVGSKVIIEGGNFGYDKTCTRVKFGNLMAVVDSVSGNKIFATVPTFNCQNNVQISVQMIGMKTESPKMKTQTENSFEVIHPWKKINDYKLEGFSFISFSMGDKGFIQPFGASSMYEFDSKSNQVKSFNIQYLSQPIQTVYAPLCASNETKAYFLYDNKVYSFNPETYEFTLITNYKPTRNYYNEFMFLFNDEIYIGSVVDKTLMKFDQNTNSWVNKKFGTELITTGFSQVKAFNYKNTVYLLYYPNPYNYNMTIFKYLPLSDSWEKLTDFYQEDGGYGSPLFIDNKIYIDISNGRDDLKSFWSLDLNTRKWEQKKELYPFVNKQACFSIGHNGYVFDYNFSWEIGASSSNEIWEFDTTKQF